MTPEQRAIKNVGKQVCLNNEHRIFIFERFKYILICLKSPKYRI